MNAPTGMSFATGQHFGNVAAQMNAYINNNAGPSLQPVQGHGFAGQRTFGPVYGTNYNAGGTFGYSPMMNDNKHTMANYTGMGPATINHFRHVAAQMNAHQSHGGGQFLQPVQGQMFQYQPTITPMYASNFQQSGGQAFGYGPMLNDPAGDFGRAFMRNLFAG